MEAILDRRLKAFNRSLDLLAKQENRPLWENVSPLIFTAKYGEAATMVQAIEDAAKKQEAGLGGVTEQKNREETELEDADFILAQAVALWLTDKGREAEAGEIDADSTQTGRITVLASPHVKCERCWHWRDDVGHDPAHVGLCGRCTSNLHGAGETRHVA